VLSDGDFWSSAMARATTCTLAARHDDVCDVRRTIARWRKRAVLIAAGDNKNMRRVDAGRTLRLNHSPMIANGQHEKRRVRIGRHCAVALGAPQQSVQFNLSCAAQVGIAQRVLGR
jgi:hypothetical protein